MNDQDFSLLIIAVEWCHVRVCFFENYIVQINLSEKGFASSGRKSSLPDWSKQLVKQIHEYMNGRRRRFDKFPLHINVYTEFQKKVWTTLQTVPYGMKISYQDLAARVGDKRLARPVGQACARNPFPVLIPCHRVVFSNGSLGGFSAGIEIKKKLLVLEE